MRSVTLVLLAGVDMRTKLRWSVMLLAATLAGCAILPYGAYTNMRLPPGAEPSTQLSFQPRKTRIAAPCNPQATSPKKQDQVLVLLALSGGGSRAALLSTAAMFELQQLSFTTTAGARSDVLHEVDAISSVSGGSLPAIYYALSSDPAQACAGDLLWERDYLVNDLMRRDFLRKWIGNWFWPQNIAKFWFSDFDRTDIMAQTLEANLFERRQAGGAPRLRDLNPLRPNLILNATAGSDSDAAGVRFGQPFTFTQEDFKRICASIDDYSAARAVMATATFPSVFNFMTLADFKASGACEQGDPSRYLHVFDGGNADNLGLTSVKRVIWRALDRSQATPTLPYAHVVVISIDAFVRPEGANAADRDPRSALSYLIDTNVVAATNSLLSGNRTRLLAEFESGTFFPFDPLSDTPSTSCAAFLPPEERGECAQAYWETLNDEIDAKLYFVHVGFDRLPPVDGCLRADDRAKGDCLQRQLQNISTNFRLETDPNPATGLSDADAIACAVPYLFGRADDSHCGDLKPKIAVNLKVDLDDAVDLLSDPRRKTPVTRQIQTR